MAMIGIIKEISTTDGQHVAIVETGSGPAVTATVSQGGAVDFRPMAGDRVLYHQTGNEIVISAIFSNDAQSGSGEWLVFSRDSIGDVVASVHLKNTGEIYAENDNGNFTLTAAGVLQIGNGDDFVALAQATNDKLDRIINAITTAAVGLVPDAGAAYKANMVTILNTPILPASVASTNLKAD